MQADLVSLAIDLLVRAWNWTARQRPDDPAWAPDDEAPTQDRPRSELVRIIGPCDDAVRHALHDWQHPLGWAARCPGLTDLGAPSEPPAEEPAAQAAAAPETITAPKPTPEPQPRIPEPAAAVSAPPAPAVRGTFREFIPALTPRGLISDLCNTGGHYECQRCRCGCHKPLTTWRP